MFKWFRLVLTALSVVAALLLGTPLHEVIKGLSQGSSLLSTILWIFVFMCAGAVVLVACLVLRSVERVVIRRRAKGFGLLLGKATICRQSSRQLHDEAIDEENRGVALGHYRELAQQLRDQLDLLWRGSEISVMAMAKKGLNMTATETLMFAADRHHDVEIDAPLGTTPKDDADKMARLQETGYGGRCVELITGQMIGVLSEVESDLGIGETRRANDEAK